MDEKEKNQKTVVAFVAGLLIGGLLVWIFSATPATNKENTITLDQDMSDQTDTAAPEVTSTSNNAVVKSATKPSTPVTTGVGSVEVADQDAGTVVALGEVKMPVGNGWLVVHELTDAGALANALGAVRYSGAEGLTPSTIELLRATVAGKSYRVVVYSENGDRVFDKADDTPVLTPEGARIEGAFKAK